MSLGRGGLTRGSWQQESWNLSENEQQKHRVHSLLVFGLSETETAIVCTPSSWLNSKHKSWAQAFCVTVSVWKLTDTKTQTTHQINFHAPN